jgi:hypothetical protein
MLHYFDIRNKLPKNTFQIVLFVGKKFTNLLSRSRKALISNRKRENPGNILNMGQKTGIYPDFNMRILACRKGIS